MICWPSTPEGAAFQGILLWSFCTTEEKSGKSHTPFSLLYRLRMVCIHVSVSVKKIRSCPLSPLSRHTTWECRLLGKRISLRAANDLQKTIPEVKNIEVFKNWGNVQVCPWKWWARGIEVSLWKCWLYCFFSLFFCYWKCVSYNGLLAGLLWCGFYCSWLTICGDITALK